MFSHVWYEMAVLNTVSVPDTRRIESFRGIWNVVCRGKIRRYTMERQKRRQDARVVLTLRDESVGSKGD